MAANERRRTSFRSLLAGLLGRILRRGFFRIVLLLFILFAVLPMIAMQALANRGTANWIMDQAAEQVFNLQFAEVTWNRLLTEFRGPDIALAGVISFHELRVTRRAGATPHPARDPLEYDFLTVPRVDIYYDIKRLPDLIVSRVEIPEGLELHFNISQGSWLDQDLFRMSEGTADPPSLPQVVLGQQATVRVRADGILVPPESLDSESAAPALWYDLVLKDLGLVPSAAVRNAYNIRGRIEGDRFGDFELGGTVERSGQRVEVQFRTATSLVFDREYSQVLAEDVRNIVEQFSINAQRTTLTGRLLIEPERELDFRADLKALEGSACYVGFPLKIDDVSADIAVRNNRIRVDATGRRGGATVSVSTVVDAVGTDSETVQVNVAISDLLVDENFRLALLDTREQPDNMNYATGLPYSEEEWADRMARGETIHAPGYPEWHRASPGEDNLYPSLSPVFSFLARGLAPMGLTDFQLRYESTVLGINRETRERTVTDALTFKVFVRNASACFVGLPEDGPGFPVPLHSLYGVVEGTMRSDTPSRFVVRGYEQAELEELGSSKTIGFTAHGNRGMAGTLESSGERVYLYAVYSDEPVPGAPPVLELTVSAEGVNFNERIRTRMPEAVQEIIQPFAPSGLVDLNSARITIPFEADDDGLQYDFALTAREVVAQYQIPGAPEPIRLREIQGSIASAGEGVRLNEVRGRIGDSNVRLSVDYRGDDVEFSIESEDFSVTPELRQVVPPGLAEILRQFDFRGYIGMSISGLMSEEAGNRMSAVVNFRGGSGARSGRVRFERFPYELIDIEGRLDVSMTPDVVEVIIRGFNGRGASPPGVDAPARVSISGHVIMPLAEDDSERMPIVDLEIRATGVPVEERLLSALTPMFQGEAPVGEKPALITFIEDLQVTQTIGVVGRFVIYESEEMDWRFELNLEDTGVSFRHFPLPIRNLAGAVVIERDFVRMRNVVGKTDTGQITLHEAGYAEDTGWYIAVSGRNLDFTNQRMRQALPEALRAMVLRINPSGFYDIDLHLGGKDAYMSYDVSLDVWKASVDLGLTFEDMTARFNVHGAIDGEHQRMNGRVYVEEAYFKGALFNDVTSSIQYVGDRLELPNLRGRFYEGFLEGRFGMVGNDYSGEIAIQGANLGLLGAMIFPDAGALSGAIDAEVRFHSRIDNQGQIGRGRIDVQPFDRTSSETDRATANLGPVPLFSAISAGEAFDEAHVFFWLGTDRIIIRELDVVSTSTRIEKFGGDEENFIMYDTAIVRMKLFHTLAPRSFLQLPVVQFGLDWLKQILAPYYVTGTLNDPRVEAFSLSASDLDREEADFPRRPRGG